MVVLVVEVLWIIFCGQRLERPSISRDLRTFGRGRSLRFAVLGDSTAVSMGGDYEQGYAVAVARHLAQKHKITWGNVAIPGARIADVVREQITDIAQLRPDIALVAVGANDVTHFTQLEAVRRSFEELIEKLRAINPDMRIVLTGAPAMGTAPRFMRITRRLMAMRTQAVNRIVIEISKRRRVIFAPIAAETEEIYRAHPELFAADKFHPTTEGYLPWIAVLKRTFDRADLTPS